MADISSNPGTRVEWLPRLLMWCQVWRVCAFIKSRDKHVLRSGPRPLTLPRKVTRSTMANTPPCMHCSAVTTSSLACGDCKMPLCSRDCQVASWPYHKHVCGLIRKPMQCILPVTIASDDTSCDRTTTAAWLAYDRVVATPESAKAADGEATGEGVANAGAGVGVGAGSGTSDASVAEEGSFPSPPPPPVYLHNFCDSGQGYGLVAARDLRCGEMLFAEPPLVAGKKKNASDAQARKRLMKAVNGLPAAKQAGLYALHGGEGGGASASSDRGDVALRILRGNGYPLSEDVGGLFPLTARINHSCTPNVHHWWSPDRHVRGVFAARDIKAGEQLTCRYVDTIAPREDRHHALRVHFGFTCACTTCARPAPEVAASDARRREAARLDGEVVRLCQESRYAEAVEAVESMLALLKAEGLDMPASVSRCAHDAYQVMQHAADRPAARRWLSMALKHARLSKVPGCEALEQMERKLVAIGGDPAVVDSE